MGSILMVCREFSMIKHEQSFQLVTIVEDVGSVTYCLSGAYAQSNCIKTVKMVLKNYFEVWGEGEKFI